MKRNGGVSQYICKKNKMNDNPFYCDAVIKYLEKFREDMLNLGRYLWDVPF